VYRRSKAFSRPAFRLLRRATLVIVVAVLAAGAVEGTAAAVTPKKGVSAANVSGVAAALKDSGSSWYYTWASDPQGIATPPGVEFVPMIWGQGSVTTAQLNSAKANGKSLLAFNEPDLAGQANMSVDTALSLWPRLQSTGLHLGAPAVAYGGDVAGGWLDRFMAGAAAHGYPIDFIPLHWYGGDFSTAATGELQGYLQAVYNRYHKPIWLTEYALINYSGSTPSYPSAAQQADFVTRSTAMLKGLSYVQRYAWFSLSTATTRTGLYSGSTPNSSGVTYRSAS
jgi:hypothetical protein